jgi:hypothetical protein
MPIPLPTVGATDIVSNVAHGSAAFSVIVPSGTNRLLTLAAHYVRNAEVFISTITYGAANLLLGTTAFIVGTTYVTEVWYLPGPVEGTDTLTVTWGGTNNILTHLLVPIHAVSVRQVDPFGDVRTRTGSNSSNSELAWALRYGHSRLLHFDSLQASGAQTPHAVPDDPPLSTQVLTELYDTNTDEGGPQAGDVTGFCMTAGNTMSALYISSASLSVTNANRRIIGIELVSDTESNVDITLRSVPADADSDDVRLYEPGVADAAYKVLLTFFIKINYSSRYISKFSN